MATTERFEGIDPVFGEAKAELEDGGGAATDLRPFLFWLHAPEPARLQVVASDFHSLTWELSLSPQQLQDLRDDIGIGGLWSEFLHYLIESISSGDVRIILGGLQNIKGDSGMMHAKLVAHKSKGLPRISLPLNKLMNSSASDAIANLSLALFRAFKNKHNDVMKGQERLSRLEGLLSSEREKSESLEKQLDALSFLSKRKVPKPKASDKTSSIPDTDGNVITASENSTSVREVPSTKDPQSMKINHRPAPVSRRILGMTTIINEWQFQEKLLIVGVMFHITYCWKIITSIDEGKKHWRNFTEEALAIFGRKVYLLLEAGGMLVLDLPDSFFPGLSFSLSVNLGFGDAFEPTVELPKLFLVPKGGGKNTFRRLSCPPLATLGSSVRSLWESS